MGDVTIKVLQDIAYIMTIEPFKYVTGTVILACVIILFKKLM